MAEVNARRKTRRASQLGIPKHSADPIVIPAELVSHILGFLPEASLWQAAGVSRQFYTSAWDVGLFIHRSLFGGDLNRCHQQLASFDELVKHALLKNLPLGLSFWWPQPSGRNDIGYPRMDDILPVISSALPLLVYFSINSGDIEQVIPILCHPMPRLRDLDITHTTYRHANPYPLPRDLLAGHAPLLQKLELGNVTLPTSALPAFSNVTALRFSYDSAPSDLPFARHFPRLADLSLKSLAFGTRDPSQRTNLTGLSLQSLTCDVEMLPGIQRTVALNTIRVLRCKHDSLSINWLEPDSEDTADFSLRLGGHLERDSQRLAVVVVPAHRRWRRIYDVYEWFPGTVLPLADKPGGTARLTYLRVENVVLHAFLSCDAAFPALKEIQLDFFKSYPQPALVWPPDASDVDFNGIFQGLFLPEHRTAPTFDNTESPYTLTCPALEELALFAFDERIIVHSPEVAFLGRALGQLNRAQGEKATLALVGVKFALPEARTLLGLTFSAVRRYAFAGRDSTDDLDDGLWDVETA